MKDDSIDDKAQDPMDPLDQILRSQLSRQLDAHVGRAADAFLADTDAANPRHTAARWWWATPLLAAAATIAIFAGPVLRFAQPSGGEGPSVAQNHSGTNTPQSHPLPSIGDGTTPVSYEPRDVEGVIRWANRDEGTVWLDDDTPARKIRRQRFETLQWTDPRDSSRIEITIPHEEIVLVSSPKF